MQPVPPPNRLQSIYPVNLWISTPTKESPSFYVPIVSTHLVKSVLPTLSPVSSPYQAPRFCARKAENCGCLGGFSRSTHPIVRISERQPANCVAHNSMPNIDIAALTWAWPRTMRLTVRLDDISQARLTCWTSGTSGKRAVPPRIVRPPTCG